MSPRTGGLRIGPALPNLIRWGLSADADLVYRTLLESEPAQGQPAALQNLGLGGRRAKAALDELVGADLATSSRLSRGRVQWSVRDPRTAVAIVRRRRFAAVDPWDQTRRFVAAVAGLGLPEHVETVEGIRRLVAADVRARIRALVALERHEHLAMQPEQVFSADALAAALPLDRALVSRGVHMRILGRSPADGDRLCPPNADAGSDADDGAASGEYRESNQIPFKTMVFDRSVALLPAGPRPEHGVLEIADHSLVRQIVASFFQHWAPAWDPQRLGVKQITLSRREKAIVEGLARGLTDERVAQQLRISARTVGYALRALMDRLGVDNRFQLGLALGAAGAAPIPDLPPEEAEQ